LITKEKKGPLQDRSSTRRVPQVSDDQFLLRDVDASEIHDRRWQS
jgi:hypothetical protein